MTSNYSKWEVVDGAFFLGGRRGGAGLKKVMLLSGRQGGCYDGDVCGCVYVYK